MLIFWFLHPKARGEFEPVNLPEQALVGVKRLRESVRPLTSYPPVMNLVNFALASSQSSRRIFATTYYG